MPNSLPHVLVLGLAGISPIFSQLAKFGEAILSHARAKGAHLVFESHDFQESSSANVLFSSREMSLLYIISRRV